MLDYCDEPADGCSEFAEENDVSANDTRTVSLEIHEIIFVIAHLVGSSELQDPDVRKLWFRTKGVLVSKLMRELPASITTPIDLFES